jgi:malate synthase
MAVYIAVEGLHVDEALHRFVVNELLPGSGIEEDSFWSGLGALIDEYSPRNAELLEKREWLQTQIDAWHKGHVFDVSSYRRFLEDIGYLVPPGEPFTITTSDVDPEISTVAGPQLVVPVMNERYALNAANARWGSLYDALYGTDALGSDPVNSPYDAARGAQVIEWVRTFLDDVTPLEGGSHVEAKHYEVANGALVVQLDGGGRGLLDPSQFAGYLGDPANPSSVFLCNHGLHIELVIDSTGSVGQSDEAGINDVVIESALTTIMDCEDSVAAVDAADKVVVYRNWLGLMKGDLCTEVRKGDGSFIRRLADDRKFVGPDGNEVTLSGRALLLVRNVGHLMTTSAVLDRNGEETPEGLLDALLTVAAAVHDLSRCEDERNSRHGSIYVVKPKMHGPDEVAFANDMFGAVERVLGLAPLTVKIGLMDEERRTTLNLAACIRAARGRIAFINTGFLDRTGDEIHTSMCAGAMVRKADMRSQTWLKAYEDNNVDVGLACGLKGRAQIGKGMWAAPDLMHDMLREKIAQPLAGASCAWVPSPTAATLHATHYHRVSVGERQIELEGRESHPVEELLTIPIALNPSWTAEDRRRELENNAQGILGYVVRWIDQGVGCSKVPDIHDVALMEDRATCRISSQHIANWLSHGVVSRESVDAAMRRMAEVVDAQNADDPHYTAMGPGFDGVAFVAACELVYEGVRSPSGYTEPILHARRVQRKSDIGATA